MSYLRVACLRKLPAEKLISGTSARYLVVDGTYLVSPELDLSRQTGPSGIDLVMGITHDDGAPSSSTPSPSLFPLPPTPNATLALFNSSSRLATDGIFRCIDQATVQAGLTNNRFSRVFYYEFDRNYQTGDPNPEEGFLRARGFESTRRETQRSEWTASSRREGVKLKVLDWPSRLENA
ncbi:hypothetical protein QBC32DRAFT_322821 [Pseudoneurospora amorphoporcata]|uniref:Uncharacterized protein n=1 Tax=Pseudoneurospora amorphoporcata TaxID=241081 RepID=A0AAN6NY45_9PEZI|nr:hypothetical protein QBC32DRAFT_322821 [Pseudoneurospora amorphoporcata]